MEQEEGPLRKGGDRRSMACRWWQGEAPEVAEEAVWRCWKHYSQPRYGVCPACLRDRLLLLCPDCSKVRPCACFQSPPSSSSSTSSANPARGGADSGAAIGEMGPMSWLIESELSFRRSRSVGFPLLRSASAVSAASHVCDMAETAGAQPGSGGRSFPSLWPRKMERSPAEAKMHRSRSVAAWRSSEAGRGGEEGRKKGLWSWRIPSPMKALRQLMSAAAKAAGERSRL